MKVMFLNKGEIAEELQLAGWLASVSADYEPTLAGGHERVARHCINSTHGTPTRAMRFVFEISEVSRAFSHEFVRHELGLAKVQRSQRYVSEDGFGFVTPKGLMDIRCLVTVPIYNDEGFFINNVDTWLTFNQFQGIVRQMYEGYVAQGAKPEDARYALTNATFTKIRVSFDWEGLENFCMRRRCLRAQWEIREVADLIVAEIAKEDHLLAERLTAPCDKHGYCPEEKGCGKAPKKAEVLGAYKRMSDIDRVCKSARECE